VDLFRIKIFVSYSVNLKIIYIYVGYELLPFEISFPFTSSVFLKYIFLSSSIIFFINP